MLDHIHIIFVTWLITYTSALQWKQLASSDLANGPVGRTSPSNVMYRDSLVMYGGANHCGNFRPTYNDTWLFNLTTLQWTRLLTINDPPLGRWGHFAWIDPLFDSDSMLIFGGRHGEKYDLQAPFSDVWRLNLKTFIWSKLNDGIPGKTIMVGNNGAIATPEGKIFFLNSNRATSNVSAATEIWLYDVHTNTFTSVPILSSFVPKQEWLFSVVALNWVKKSNNHRILDNLKSLVVYGGWEQNQFYRFNVQTGKFINLTSIGPKPPDSAGHVAISARTATEESVYMMWSAKNQPELWFYSYAEHTWSSMNLSSPAPSPRLYTQIVPISNSGAISLLTPIICLIIVINDGLCPGRVDGDTTSLCFINCAGDDWNNMIENSTKQKQK
ncbi:unnamed protein product [Rotaria sordida]|uniref:Uncharacterized protein n=1 Tax=Rotaria sordida TaxID=392033 RepID=A0A819FTA9_9BILA|nr:unnamed protein product [Rotaria sordida]CAF3873546.1 unnamed protein product [Rotaria sordida]